ncbi:F-box/LRR-repeat protein [Spatholobus suberectus]|nr:F-box/LRR-repeat protein [Spatholobus suberectus]
MTNRRKPGEDRISVLPDDVLCHILSFLATKEAIATSSLSTRWRFLWSMVPSLDIECSKPITRPHESVSVFLALRRTEKTTRFRLKCNSRDCCSRYAEEWVSAVTARKVEHVNISLSTSRTGVLSFAALFTCTAMVTLNLEGCFDLRVPSSVRLPNLKTLHLHINGDGVGVRRIISGSPALELFLLKQSPIPDHFNEVKIVRNSPDIQYSQRNWLYDLVVRSDRDCDFISDYVEYRWPNAVKAKVYMKVYDGNKRFGAKQIVTDILQRLCDAEFLSLGYFGEEMEPSTLDLPLFKNLVELRLSLKSADSLFMELPAKCPKLKVLEVNFVDDRNNINQRCRYRVSGGAWESDL